MMVAIPTTSGTGSEVTPFAIITDDETHVKYAIADYALTPNMAIIDANFVDHMPKGLTAASGFDALVHAVEAYVSVMATNFTIRRLWKRSSRYSVICRVLIRTALPIR